MYKYLFDTEAKVGKTRFYNWKRKRKREEKRFDEFSSSCDRRSRFLDRGQFRLKVDDRL